MYFFKEGTEERRPGIMRTVQEAKERVNKMDSFPVLKYLSKKHPYL